MKRTILGFLVGALVTIGLFGAYIQLVLPWLRKVIEEHGSDTTTNGLLNLAMPLAFSLGCGAACRVAGRYQTRLAAIWAVAGVGFFVGLSILTPELADKLMMPMFSLGYWGTWFMLLLMVVCPLGAAVGEQERMKKKSDEEKRAEALGELGTDALETGVEIVSELHKHLHL